MLGRFLGVWGLFRGDGLFTQRKYVEAIKVYEKIDNPVDLRFIALAMIARAYYLLSHFEKSKDYFLKLRIEAENITASGGEYDHIANYFIVYANLGLSTLREKIDLGFHLDDIIFDRDNYMKISRRILRAFPLSVEVSI